MSVNRASSHSPPSTFEDDNAETESSESPESPEPARPGGGGFSSGGALRRAHRAPPRVIARLVTRPRRDSIHAASPATVARRRGASASAEDASSPLGRRRSIPSSGRGRGRPRASLGTARSPCDRRRRASTARRARPRRATPSIGDALPPTVLASPASREPIQRGLVQTKAARYSDSYAAASAAAARLTLRPRPVAFAFAFVSLARSFRRTVAMKSTSGILTAVGNTAAVFRLAPKLSTGDHTVSPRGRG